MKKQLTIFLSLLLSLLLLGCELDEKEAAGLAVPNMGNASDLPATGAETYPATKKESLELLSVSLMKAEKQIAAVAEEVAKSYNGSRYNIEVNESLNIDKEGIMVTGTATGDIFIADEVFAAFASDQEVNLGNKEFSPALSAGCDADLDVNIDITDTDLLGNEYSISGKIAVKAKVNAKVDLVTTVVDTAFNKTDAEATVDIDAGVAVGLTLSVSTKDYTGKTAGAKYIMSFASTAKADSFKYNKSTTPEEIMAKISNTDFVLKVYDDENNEIGNYTITPDDFKSEEQLY